MKIAIILLWAVITVNAGEWVSVGEGSHKGMNTFGNGSGYDYETVKDSVKIYLPFTEMNDSIASFWTMWWSAGKINSYTKQLIVCHFMDHKVIFLAALVDGEYITLPISTSFYPVPGTVTELVFDWALIFKNEMKRKKE